MQAKNKSISLSLSIPFSGALTSTIQDFAKKTEPTETHSENEGEEVTPSSRIPKFSPKIDFKNIADKFKNMMPKKVKGSKLAVVIAVLVVISIAYLGIRSVADGAGKTSSSQTSGFAPSSTKTVNKTFMVPIRTAKGEDSGQDLKVTLTTIDKTNKILIQGQPAEAKDGKVFVILNLEVENSMNNQLTVRPVDLIRLVDSQNRNFAPDIHNNDVTVEAISIKKTRAGFVVDNSQKNFKFLIGEVNGPKETVEVSF